MTHTRRLALTAFTLLGSALVGLTPHQALRAADNTTSTVAGSVTVSVRYTGKGDVNDSHRLWVWLFDTPNIGPGAMPVHEAFVSSNGGSVTIEGVGPDQVWIAVAYDERGGSSGNAPPAPGSPVGIYVGADGRPASITTGKDATAAVTFDDSVRMP